MKRPLAALRGIPVVAHDGTAGTLADVHLHDSLWVVRTLALETKSPHARRLLVPISSVRQCRYDLPAIAVDMTLTEIAAASRRADLSLRSARSLYGYGVEACDGPAGRCEDVLLEDAGWAIAGFVVNSRGARYFAPAGAVAAVDPVRRALRLRIAGAQLLRVCRGFPDSVLPALMLNG